MAMWVSGSGGARIRADAAVVTDHPAGTTRVAPAGVARGVSLSFWDGRVAGASSATSTSRSARPHGVVRRVFMGVDYTLVLSAVFGCWGWIVEADLGFSFCWNGF